MKGRTNKLPQAGHRSGIVVTARYWQPVLDRAALARDLGSIPANPGNPFGIGSKLFVCGGRSSGNRQASDGIAGFRIHAVHGRAVRGR